MPLTDQRSLKNIYLSNTVFLGKEFALDYIFLYNSSAYI